MKIEVKLFEVRDRATFIPAYCVRFRDDLADTQEWFLLRAAGWGPNPDCIYMTLLEGGDTSHNPHGFKPGGRILQVAYAYIENHWDQLESGQIIDVEYILKETDEPKKSERFAFEAGYLQLVEKFGREIL